jgi:hypothetical protein
MKQISSKQICSKKFLPYSYTLQVTHACSLFTWIFSTYLMHVFFTPGIHFTHTVHCSLYCTSIFMLSSFFSALHMLSTEYYCLSFPQKKNSVWKLQCRLHREVSSLSKLNQRVHHIQGIQKWGKEVISTFQLLV